MVPAPEALARPAEAALGMVLVRLVVTPDRRGHKVTHEFPPRLLGPTVLLRHDPKPIRARELNASKRCLRMPALDQGEPARK